MEGLTVSFFFSESEKIVSGAWRQILVTFCVLPYSKLHKAVEKTVPFYDFDVSLTFFANKWRSKEEKENLT